MIDVEKVKQMYPDPVVGCDTVSKAQYCVGGAFMRYVGVESCRGFYFPSKVHLSDILQKYNEELDRWEALSYASRIIYANDQGRFDDAWMVLGEALEYGSIERTVRYD